MIMGHGGEEEDEEEEGEEEGMRRFTEES